MKHRRQNSLIEVRRSPILLSLMVMLGVILLSGGVNAIVQEYFYNDTVLAGAFYDNEVRFFNVHVGYNAEGDFIVTNISLKLYRVGTVGNLMINITNTTSELVPNQSQRESTGIFDASAVTTNTEGEWYNISMSNATLKHGQNYSIIVQLNGGDSSNKLYMKAYDGTSYYPYSVGIGNKSWSWTVYDPGLYTRIFELHGTAIASTITVTLNSPEDDSLLSSLDFPLEFNSSITSTGITLTNATLYIWNSTEIVNATEFKNLNGSSNSTAFIITTLPANNYIWNVLSCGKNSSSTICQWAASNFTFQLPQFSVDSEAYEYTAYETSRQMFNISITTLENILSVSSKLNYDNTEYTVSTVCTESNCSISKAIDIPLATAESQNKTFLWQITVFDGTTSYTYNTTTRQQNISRIHLEQCGATYNTGSLNFTAIDEQNLTRINSFAFKGTFETWLGGGTVKRNISFSKSNISNVSLCIYPTSLTHFTDAVIEYTANTSSIQYVTRNYYLQNASITSTLQNIPLYLLNSDDSTSFIIHVLNQELSNVADALVLIQRYYPGEGIYRTIGITKTDSNGEGVGFYEVENVDYKHLITLNGTLLLDSPAQKIVGKEVPYTLTFTTGSSLAKPWSFWESDPNIAITLTFDKDTNIVSFSYIDSTGLTTRGRLLVQQENINNATTKTICNQTASLSAATITCNLTGYSGNFIAYGYIDNEFSDLINFIITTAREIFGNEGAIWGWFIILISGFAFAWNPTAGIVGINAALWFVSLSGLLTFSPLFIIGILAVSILGIILLKT